MIHTIPLGTAGEKRTDGLKLFQRTVMVCFWLGLLWLCLVYKDEITVEKIAEYTPANPMLAAIIMLCLFALKSVTFFIYGGILYAANGILFELPIAILMNIAGTVVMTTIPFLIGRKAGANTLADLTHKNPKLEMLRGIPNRNELFVSFFVRIVGMLPGDLVGMYLGASGIRYSRYFWGTIFGLLPAIVSFSVMGMSAHDVSSPEFIVSVCFEVGLAVLSIVLYLILKWRKAKE